MKKKMFYDCLRRNFETTFKLAENERKACQFVAKKAPNFSSGRIQQTLNYVGALSIT